MEKASTSDRSTENQTLELLRTLCELHNQMPGKLKGYDCPVCRNKGWIYVLRDVVEVLRECECMPVRESLRRMQRSGLANRLELQTFQSFRTNEPWQAQIRQKAERYAEQHDMPAFFIGGQQGSGKTHLCTAICASLLRQGFHVQYFVWETYVKEILVRSGSTDRFERDALMKPLLHSQVVYLDDFFRKKDPTQAERSVAFDVTNHRYTEGSITIVSSEHTMPELLQTDQAVASRIKEMCGKTYCLNIDANEAKNYRTQE